MKTAVVNRVFFNKDAELIETGSVSQVANTVKSTLDSESDLCNEP